MARLDVLLNGYASDKGVAGTVSLIRDGEFVAIVDPGMVPTRESILDPLASHGISPDDSINLLKNSNSVSPSAVRPLPMQRP